MILFKFREKQVTDEKVRKCFAAVRWVIESRAWKVEKTRCVGLTLSRELKRLDEDTWVWFSYGPCYSVTLNTKFEIGEDHAWYDGEHCSWSFGFIHFGRDWISCKKCHKSLTDER